MSEPASHASLVAAPALQLQPGRRHVLAGCYSALMKSSILAIHFEVMDVRRCLVAQCVWTRTAFPNSLENRACLSSSALGVKTWLKFKMKRNRQRKQTNGKLSVQYPITKLISTTLNDMEFGLSKINKYNFKMRVTLKRSH